MSVVFDTVQGSTGPSASFGDRVSSFTTATGFETGGADRIVLAFIGYNTDDNAGGTPQTVSSVTDANGLTWTKRKSMSWTYMKSGFNIYQGLDLWWAHAPTTVSSPDAVTVNFSGTIGNVAIQLLAYSGVGSLTAPFDTNSGLAATNTDVSGSSTTPEVTGVTTDFGPDMYVMALVSGDLTTNTAGSGYSLILGNGGMTNADGVENSTFSVQQQSATVALASATEPFGTAGTNWGVLFDALTSSTGGNVWASIEGPDVMFTAGYPGAFGIVGDLQAVEGVDTFAATIVGSITMSMSAAEFPDTFSAFIKQTVTVTAVLAATEGPDHMVAVGIGLGENGVWTSTEGPDIFAASVGSPVSGVLAATEAPDTFSALGAGATRSTRRRQFFVT